MISFVCFYILQEKADLQREVEKFKGELIKVKVINAVKIVGAIALGAVGLVTGGAAAAGVITVVEVATMAIASITAIIPSFFR